jgi:hypothetical protein
MQCRPITALPAGEKWTFEIKFDGYRCIAVKREREVTLFSRHEKVLSNRFPAIVEALASLEGDFDRRRVDRAGTILCKTFLNSRFQCFVTPSIY